MNFSTLQKGDYVRVTWYSAGTIPATKKMRISKVLDTDGCKVKLTGFEMHGFIGPDDGYQLKAAS